MEEVLELKHICYAYHTLEGETPTLTDISFALKKGEFVAIVGPSGCGKSTLLSIIAGLLSPERGLIKINGKYQRESTTNVGYMLQHDELFEWRSIYNNVILGLEVQHMLTARTREKAYELLDVYGLKSFARSRPSELSGGMRQRVMIAMALACSPGLIIADEPTTALDVTIQAQILDLLKELKDKINSSIMLITHDLGVIASMADYVVVMYAGRVVEKGTTEDIFHNPCHPYTIGLMKSKPVVGKKVDALYNIPGSVPNPVNMPDYCYFRDRCEQCVEKCQGVYPPEIRVSDTHVVSCWRYDGQGEVVRWPKSVNVEEL